MNRQRSVGPRLPGGSRQREMCGLGEDRVKGGGGTVWRQENLQWGVLGKRKKESIQKKNVDGSRGPEKKGLVEGVRQSKPDKLSARKNKKPGGMGNE